MTHLWKPLFLTLSAGVFLVCTGCPPVDPVTNTAASKTSTPLSDDPSLAETTTLPGPSPVADQGQPLKERIEAAIDNVRQRDLLISYGFWSVFHGILGLGPDIELKHPQLGIRVKAVDYICSGGELRGLRFIPTEYGVDVESGETFISQGHQDQFIAEMAQCGIPADREFIVGGKRYKFLDFVHHSQKRARVAADQELSWTIVVVGQYLGTDIPPWTNSLGEQLSYEDLVRYEVDAIVEQATCGGTHRLFGLKWAQNLHLQKGGKTVGVWKDLEDEQVKYQQLARKYQNADGSFSTESFRGPGDARDMQLRMNTTGHILEWLAYALPVEELRREWVERAASRLALMFWEIKNQSMETGSLYHAVHGLRIYYARVFGDSPKVPKPFLILPPDAVASKGKK
jgi:hypothetical protein